MERTVQYGTLEAAEEVSTNMYHWKNEFDKNVPCSTAMSSDRDFEVWGVSAVPDSRARFFGEGGSPETAQANASIESWVVLSAAAA